MAENYTSLWTNKYHPFAVTRVNFQPPSPFCNQQPASAASLAPIHPSDSPLRLTNYDGRSESRRNVCQVFWTDEPETNYSASLENYACTTFPSMAGKGPRATSRGLRGLILFTVGFAVFPDSLVPFRKVIYLRD